MNNYQQWNNAIAEYFLQGLPTGSTIYLSLDPVALLEIANRLTINSSGEEPWMNDFLTALRDECIKGERVQLPTEGLNDSGIPCGVAFIGAMVLAAYLMMDEQTEEGMLVSETNYFKRLRTILNLDPEERGRPAGLNPPGIEGRLWQQWNEYLLGNGYLPSAEAGQGIANKYINYPLSQALLRNADRERLERVFRKEEKAAALSRSLDLERLNIWLKNNSHLFTSSHLKDLLKQDDRRRSNAVHEAIYDVYTQVEWDKELIDYSYKSGLERQLRLRAGLYRMEDPFIGQIEYLLYPQIPRRYQASELKLEHESGDFELKPERAGWYQPLWPINPAGGISYSVKGDFRIHELTVPEKGFWVLIRDPENPDTGVFASWGYPDLGETFLLLCCDQYSEQLELLFQENLMKWDHAIELTGSLHGWVEYRECMVVSENWDCIIPVNPELIEALKPNIRASISLKNGLRIPPQLRWVEGYGPDMTVVGFTDTLKLQLYELSDSSQLIKDELVETNQSISLSDLYPGSYVVKISEGLQTVAIKTFHVVAWNELEPQTVEHSMGLDLGDYFLEGALIRRKM